MDFHFDFEVGWRLRAEFTPEAAFCLETVFGSGVVSASSVASGFETALPLVAVFSAKAYFRLETILGRGAAIILGAKTSSHPTGLFFI